MPFLFKVIHLAKWSNGTSVKPKSAHLLAADPKLRNSAIILSEVDADKVSLFPSGGGGGSSSSSPNSSSLGKSIAKTSLLTVGEIHTVQQFSIHEERDNLVESRRFSVFDLGPDVRVKCITMSREASDGSRVWVGTGTPQTFVTLIDLSSTETLKRVEVPTY